jgi:sulfite dehydrogenase (quinone) subunit SoeC
MHPALSVIFFTTLSGAGLGLLFLHGALMLWFPDWFDASARVPSLIVGSVLLVSGLFASLLHLGRPERAWRALSQWRSSWLSREGVAAVATIAASLGMLVLYWRGASRPATAVLSAALATLAVITIWCTARIYTSLPTIAAWHNRWVLPNFLALALATGSLWLWLLMPGYRGDAGPTLESATGLGRIGKVSPFEAPHTETNYLLNEMGFVVARRHAVRLRTIALVLGYALPLLVAAASAWSGRDARWIAGVALLLCVAGVFVERWLFFAEARHVITLYYRGTAP